MLSVFLATIMWRKTNLPKLGIELVTFGKCVLYMKPSRVNLLTACQAHFNTAYSPDQSAKEGGGGSGSGGNCRKPVVHTGLVNMPATISQRGQDNDGGGGNSGNCGPSAHPRLSTHMWLDNSATGAGGGLTHSDIDSANMSLLFDRIGGPAGSCGQSLFLSRFHISNMLKPSPFT